MPSPSLAIISSTYKLIILIFKWSSPGNTNSQVYQFYIDTGDDRWEVQEHTT